VKKSLRPTAGAQGFHVASTGFPQRRFATLILALTSASLVVCPAFATVKQTPAPPREVTASVDPGPVFRVFLNDGHALPSYGEYAVLNDRVVFTLVIGSGGLSTQYQLMSLPLTAVDLERTTRYRDAVRAARYAATRGETDYTEMTAEVSRSLDQLSKIEDPKARLAAAEEAKRRLLAWSEQNYHYRAKDIQELAAQFDEVIAQLRVSAGEPRISMSFVAGAPIAPPEPIKRAPTLRESIELALAAVAASDVSTDRAAILHAAQGASAELVGSDDVASAVSRRITEEQDADRAFMAFRNDAITRAQTAQSRGDVTTAANIRREAEVNAAPAATGRAEELRGLLLDLDVIVNRTREHREALDRYAAMRPQLLAYEKSLRPVLSSLDSTTAVLNAIHDMKGPEVSKLERASTVLAKLGPKLDALQPPEGLVDVHATFISALHLAQEACRRRMLALAANNDLRLGGEAAASAAGATMLVEQARENLVTRLYPPKVR
jgi:hypothetical protein